MAKSPFGKTKKSKQELEREKQDKALEDKLDQTESGQYHKLGYTRSLTHNSKSRMLWPSDLKFVFVTITMILVVSVLCVYFTIMQADEKTFETNTKDWLIFLYCLSLLIVLIMLWKVTFTDPGIIPSVYLNSGIPNNEYNRVDNTRDYFVEYMTKRDAIEQMNEDGINHPIDQFYSFKKFEHLETKYNDEGNPIAVDSKKKQNKLSYCNTCEMLRPPRSFHCSQCGVCIEAHDHHCPWVGTCIGYRNLKYFVAFLFYTGFHALFTSGICTIVMLVGVEQINDENQMAYSAITKALLIFSSLCALCLLTFFLFQLCSLGIKNIASNEDIRHRWNGHHKNNKQTKPFRKRAGCCGRIGYTLCGNVDRIHGQSKLNLYSELVENFYALQKFKTDKHDILEDEEALENIETANLLGNELITREQRQNIRTKLQRHSKLLHVLNNLQILQKNYGITIPNSELIQMGPGQGDEDLLEMYLQQKAQVDGVDDEDD